MTTAAPTAASSPETKILYHNFMDFAGHRLDGDGPLFNTKTMDDKFTQKIIDWLNQPAQERDITDGAKMLLQLNRNRVLYANITRRPDRFGEKLEYELRKHLQIRLDGKTVADVVKMEREVMPRVERTLKEAPVISSDAEMTAGTVARGKRPDHDQLPAEIQALWDGNIENYHKVRDLHHRLKEMESAQPCDRYEYLKLLDEADKRYRENLAKYDGFVIGQEPATAVEDNTADVQAAQRDKARINAARKSISKWKGVLSAANRKDDIEKANEAMVKITAAIDDLRTAGGNLGAKVCAELLRMGLEVEVDGNE